MSVLDDEIVSNNSKLEQTMRKLSAVTVFCEELASKVAFIQKLFAQNITMQQGGLFKSANWNGTFNADTGKITEYGSQGWAQDYSGTLDVVDMHATNAKIVGDIVSDDFNESNLNKGYKLYKDPSGNGRAIIPMVKAYQISPISENKPVYFLNNKGINSRLFSLTNHNRYTKWGAIFAILGLLEDEGVVQGLMCYGKANGKFIDVMTIQRARGGNSFVRLQGYQPDGSYYDNITQLADGAYPSFSVDVMF